MGQSCGQSTGYLAVKYPDNLSFVEPRNMVIYPCAPRQSLGQRFSSKAKRHYISTFFGNWGMCMLKQGGRMCTNLYARLDPGPGVPERFIVDAPSELVSYQAFMSYPLLCWTVCMQQNSSIRPTVVTLHSTLPAL